MNYSHPLVDGWLLSKLNVQRRSVLTYAFAQYAVSLVYNQLVASLYKLLKLYSCILAQNSTVLIFLEVLSSHKSHANVRRREVQRCNIYGIIYVKN